MNTTSRVAVAAALLLTFAAGFFVGQRNPGDVGVRCLEPQAAAAEFLHIDRDGYCIAVAPLSVARPANP